MIPEAFLPWLLYGGSAVLYTGLIFRGGWPGSAKPLSAILTIHGGFLAVLLAAVRIARLIYPKLPNWLTVTVSVRGGPISAFEFLLVVAVVGMHFLERRWLNESAPAEDRVQEPGS